ncbi:GNAT family N-acetyltransferase [Panacibacter ginsenosidivorans]|uniref:GNAT family N-acetyltransferase n=1 Tax=Panacibacter ginsenosidivorans TaxID=1813871 RepID=A0A5B8V978_9BACT|nr:GNAT family N-acetyltransferase [Panacibacter ginsenosidivorans]QEC67695.1 GNAT family N-acetyltransferase [Panacibacter ginsenosidivorans]
MLLTEKDYHLVTAKVNFLEMHKQPEARPVVPEGVSFLLLQKPVDTELYRHYYRNVGFTYNWLDRLAITGDELHKKINAENVLIYALKVNNADAGYAEFALENEYTEIVYFGLFPEFVGRGLGKSFLKWVIFKAWSFGAKWIQLNTCSLDHPNALPLYQAQGFEIVQTTEEIRKVFNTKI